MNHHFDKQLGLVCLNTEALARLEQLRLRRCELVMFDRQQEAEARRAITEGGLAFGIHAPLFRDVDYPEYALMASLVDPDGERRERAVRLMDSEIRQAAEWEADYVVLHLQRNLLLNGESAPEGWDEEDGIQLAIETVSQVAETAAGLNMPIHLENMMGAPIFHSPEAYVRLCEAVPGVRLCLDIGHLALDAAYFGFDVVEAATMLAPYTGSLHVYNNQIEDDFDFPSLREAGLLRKFAVHPTQSPGHGWIPVGRLLRRVLAANPQALVTFEIYFRLEASPEQTLEGIEWVAAIIDDTNSKM